MGCQEHVHKLGYRTNQNIQKSHLNLERLTGHPNYLAIIFVPLIICSSFVSSSWFKRLFRGDVWGKLGELSMYMYFIHLFVASVYWILKGKIEFLCYIQSGLLLILYLLAVVISAWLLKIVSEKIYNIFVG